MGLRGGRGGTNRVIMRGARDRRVALVEQHTEEAEQVGDVIVDANNEQIETWSQDSTASPQGGRSRLSTVEEEEGEEEGGDDVEMEDNADSQIDDGIEAIEVNNTPTEVAAVANKRQPVAIEESGEAQEIEQQTNPTALLPHGWPGTYGGASQERSAFGPGFFDEKSGGQLGFTIWRDVY